jgi:hypothetical protein
METSLNYSPIFRVILLIAPVFEPFYWLRQKV